MEVRVDWSNVAVPVGTAAGVQFAAVLKSPLPGVALHVAFWAAAGSVVRASAEPASSPMRNRRAVCARAWLDRTRECPDTAPTIRTERGGKKPEPGRPTSGPATTLTAGLLSHRPL